MANGKQKDFFGRDVNPGTYCDPAEGKTVQQDVDAADINKILRRAGIVDPAQIQAQPGLFLDTTELGDYRALADRLVKVNEYFATLPAEVRLAFLNDPLVFLDQANDPGSHEKFVQLGLIAEIKTAPPPAAPPPVV